MSVNGNEKQVISRGLSATSWMNQLSLEEVDDNGSSLANEKERGSWWLQKVQLVGRQIKFSL